VFPGTRTTLSNRKPWPEAKPSPLAQGLLLPPVRGQGGDFGLRKTLQRSARVVQAPSPIRLFVSAAWQEFLLAVVVLIGHSEANQSKLNQTKEALEASLLALIRFFNLRL
jgi:hypothetical protein